MKLLDDTKNRIIAWDILRGIGILCVVLGHITYNDNLDRCINAFHMPLFFFISGALYKNKDGIVKKQFKNLMFPYFVFAILSFLYWYFIELRFREKHIGSNAFDQLVNIVYPMNMEGSYEFNAVLWFLPCLFVTFLSYHILHKLHIGITGDLIVLCISIVLASLIKIKIPFFISEMFCSLPFYICGSLFTKYKKQLDILSSSTNNNIAIGLFTIIIAFICVIIFNVIGNMKGNFYSHSYFVFFICALFIVFGLYLSVSGIKHQIVFQWLGMNSLCIMLIHEPIRRIITKCYSIFFSLNVDYVRESTIHSILLLLATILVVSLFTMLINKYAKILLGKF